MKYVLVPVHITSARRNPDKNPKYSFIQQIKKFYDLDSSFTLPEYFISFRGNHNKEMMTVNIHNAFDTPTGIYAYPIRFAYNENKNKVDVPYGGKLPYIYVLKRNTDDILWMKNYYKPQYDDDYEILKRFCQNNKVNFSIIKKMAVEKARHLAKKNKRKVKLIDIIWLLSEEMSKVTSQGTSTHKWKSIILNVLGYKAVIDMGLGTIHPNEPCQAIFMTKSAYKGITMFNNEKDSYNVIIL